MGLRLWLGTRYVDTYVRDYQWPAICYSRWTQAVASNTVSFLLVGRTAQVGTRGTRGLRLGSVSYDLSRYSPGRVQIDQRRSLERITTRADPTSERVSRPPPSRRDARTRVCFCRLNSIIRDNIVHASLSSLADESIEDRKERNPSSG